MEINPVGQRLDKRIVADGSIEPLLTSRLSLERETERVFPGDRDLGPGAEKGLGMGILDGSCPHHGRM